MLRKLEVSESMNECAKVAKCEENKIMAQPHSRKWRCPVAQFCTLRTCAPAAPLLLLAEAAATRTEDHGREEAAVCRNACSEFWWDMTVNLQNSLKIKPLVQKQCNFHLVDTWNMIESFETMVWIYWTIPLRSVWPALKRSSHPSTRRWTSACLLLTILILKGHWYIIIVHKYFPKSKKE